MHFALCHSNGVAPRWVAGTMATVCVRAYVSVYQSVCELRKDTRQPNALSNHSTIRHPVHQYNQHRQLNSIKFKWKSKTIQLLVNWRMLFSRNTFISTHSLIQSIRSTKWKRPTTHQQTIVDKRRNFNENQIDENERKNKGKNGKPKTSKKSTQSWNAYLLSPLPICTAYDSSTNTFGESRRTGQCSTNCILCINLWCCTCHYASRIPIHARHTHGLFVCREFPPKFFLVQSIQPIESPIDYRQTTRSLANHINYTDEKKTKLNLDDTHSTLFWMLRFHWCRCSDILQMTKTQASKLWLWITSLSLVRLPFVS